MKIIYMTENTQIISNGLSNLICEFPITLTQYADTTNFENIDIIIIEESKKPIQTIKLITEIRTKFNLLQMPIFLVVKNNLITETIDQDINEIVNMDDLENKISNNILKYQKIKLSLEKMLRAKEIDTIQIIVATMAHEINNSLTMALYIADKIENRAKSDQLKDSILNVKKTVTKLESINELTKFNYDRYIENIKKIDLKSINNDKLE